MEYSSWDQRLWLYRSLEPQSTLRLKLSRVSDVRMIVLVDNMVSLHSFYSPVICGSGCSSLLFCWHNWCYSGWRRNQLNTNKVTVLYLMEELGQPLASWQVKLLHLVGKCVFSANYTTWWQNLPHELTRVYRLNILSSLCLWQCFLCRASFTEPADKSSQLINLPELSWREMGAEESRAICKVIAFFWEGGSSLCLFVCLLLYSSVCLFHCVQGGWVARGGGLPLWTWA